MSALESRAAVRAISFDVGGTLIEPWPSVGHVYAEVAAQFGIADAAPEELNRRFSAAWKARRDFDYSTKAWRSLVEESFRGVTALVPDEACFQAIYERFASATAWRMFDDVLPTLDAARRRGFRLAVISNWDRRLEPLLFALGLDGRFDVVIGSQNAGVQKPAPEIFQRAAAALGIKPSSLLHIGDSHEEDFLGATAAGSHALLLDRTGATGGPNSVKTLASCLDWPLDSAGS